MLDRFIYEDHVGRRFDGLENGVYLNQGDLRDYSWSYDKINSRISRFYQGITNRKIPLMIMCNTDEDAVQIKNHIHDLAESDIVAKLPGKVYAGEYYTNGYITASKKGDYLTNKRLCKLDLTLTSDDPAWYREQVYYFVPGSDDQMSGGSGTDYAYDYPYDYAMYFKGRSIASDSVGNSAFRLLIFGTVENPSVTIGENTYTVNTKVGAGETLLVDSLAKTITLTNASGQKINCFDKRSRENYIFEPIRPGMNTVSWSGNFGFNLTVIDKRSEPRWT